MHRDLDALREGTFDLLIVGGGITGAGVALDAAARGLRVAVVDKGDFASGTSSVSSKLVHGGLRYLEHGYFHLVYEALHERTRLLRNAPHLVRPLRFIIPFYRAARLPGWKWRVGLTLYDLLAGRGNIRRSRPIPLSDLRREFPTLKPANLLGGAEYYDAQMDDARLCIEVHKTAVSLGARACNYVEVAGFEQAGSLTHTQCVDRLGNNTFTVHARQVLNAAGPWVDSVCARAGDTRGPQLRPTKGIHIITANPGLHAALLLLHPADGRVFFVIPWLHTHLLIGTTDTKEDVSPDGLKVRQDEIDYLLTGYNHHFEPGLQSEAVQGSFAGLRPLIRSRPEDPAAMSREYRLIESPGGLLSAAGGKYTTYRQMAEEITDVVMARLGRRGRCRTRDMPLDGAPLEGWETFVAAEVQRLRQRGLEASAARHLVDRYGRRASEVANDLNRDGSGHKSIIAGEPDLRGELIYQSEQEMAQTQADCLLRRTRLGLMYPHLLEPDRETPIPTHPGQRGASAP
ncbi:MAG: glycerol-3-phosphate dehydrogenase [Gemmataceae bacterium]